MTPMHISLFRGSGRSSIRRRHVSTGTPTGAGGEPPRRSAMGIDVQPVHGRHCICGRCQRQSPQR
ncbi:MAG TPA: hypothetical protein VE983_02550 [Solirubrobacteraceae bacterium]|nr:hypothetical protein [Solirubrobacteraceae bacterium]